MKKLGNFIYKKVRITFKDGKVKEGILYYDEWMNLYSVVDGKGVTMFLDGDQKRVIEIK